MSQTLTLDYAPFPYQEQLHNSPARFKCIAGGRRVGKSKMAVAELLKHCLTRPKANAMWVAPTLSTSRDVGWNELKELVKTIEPLIKNVNETRMEMTFLNGSLISFKGADNEPGLRGRKITYLVMDEAAFIAEDIWKKVLRPSLADSKGSAILISTPNGKNWFYYQFQYASMEKNTNWEALHWPTLMNPLISGDELKDAAQDMDTLSFKQEFMAEFITREGMVYDQFDQLNILEDGLPSPHDFDIYLGMDFGFANPSAICFMAVAKDNGEVIQFDEIIAARTPIDQLEQMIINKLARNGLSSWDVKAIYCDPAGNAEQLVSGISPVDYLRMSPQKWTVESKGSEIMPGIALVRSYICNHRGQRRFKITNNCIGSINSITSYAYAKQNTYTSTIKEEPLKDGKWDHMCDAIRYFFVNKFDKTKWIGDTPTFIDPYAKENTGKPVLKRCNKCRNQFVSYTPKDQPPYTCRECSGELAYV